MICEGLPAAVAAKAASCLIENIQIGTETGADLGNWTGIMVERGRGKETEPETGIMTGTEIEIETEIGIETGDMIMIMIVDPNIQREKAEGTMIGALVMAIDTTGKGNPVEVGVGAEAEVRACKLTMVTLIIVPVLEQQQQQMGAKRRTPQLQIWQSSEICTVTEVVIKKGPVDWKEALLGTMVVMR